MMRINRLVILIGAMTTLAACGVGDIGARPSTPVDPPPLLSNLPPPPAVSPPQVNDPTYRVLDSRNYFHQDPPQLPLTVYAHNLGSWYNLTAPEHFANLSGFVYSTLNISILGWWWIPPAGSFTGYVYRWDSGHSRWQLYRSFNGEGPVWVRDL